MLFCNRCTKRCSPCWLVSVVPVLTNCFTISITCVQLSRCGKPEAGLFAKVPVVKLDQIVKSIKGILTALQFLRVVFPCIHWYGLPLKNWTPNSLKTLFKFRPSLGSFLLSIEIKRPKN